MPLFDAYIVVDWSANSKRNTGLDSIWYAIYERQNKNLKQQALANPSTRAEATEEIGNYLARLVTKGKRVLVGFDFPFGYPAGTAQKLGFSGMSWRHIWQLLSDLIQDDPENRNNRFEVAEELNRMMGKEPFPFWGNVREETRQYLLRRLRRPVGPYDLAEWRLCERRIRSTNSVWQLAGAGSVGSQTLTGIPRVWQLRCDPRLAMASHIWPFETGLVFDARPQIVFAEVYASLIKHAEVTDKPKDAGQVVANTRYFANLDEDGRLGALFSGGEGLTQAEKILVEREEAWILGVT